ncbi:hypothetical protein [Nostoc sp. UHCC 0251]|uniref:hypothetical protein n=1 Tax=Nostoc sp. UHCC 0251 TaxID=3110240 RepID=UPI002B21AEB2|nr:hypothetical protein [Nostoc sp. UHCC 0251]
MRSCVRFFFKFAYLLTYKSVGLLDIMNIVCVGQSAIARVKVVALRVLTDQLVMFLNAEERKVNAEYRRVLPSN